jgi:hypothetical protein
MWTLTVAHFGAIFFVLSPEQVCKAIYHTNPFSESLAIGRYLKEHTAPDARIAVLGSEPEILFYAHRHSATGYIYMYDLIAGPQPYAGDMQQEMMAQIKEARPEYLVLVKIPASWDLRPDFQRAAGTAVMRWIPQFVKDYYEPVGLVIVKPESEFYWGKEEVNRPPFPEPFIGIARRK